MENKFSSAAGIAIRLRAGREIYVRLLPDSVQKCRASGVLPIADCLEVTQSKPGNRRKASAPQSLRWGCLIHFFHSTIK